MGQVTGDELPATTRFVDVPALVEEPTDTLRSVAVGVAQLVRAESRRCRVAVDDTEVFDGDALPVLVINVARDGGPSATGRRFRYEIESGAITLRVLT